MFEVSFGNIACADFPADRIDLDAKRQRNNDVCRWREQRNAAEIVWSSRIYSLEWKAIQSVMNFAHGFTGLLTWSPHLFRLYKGLIEEEIDAAKLEYWIKHGYVHPINHRPFYWAARYLRGKNPNLEHIKAWQFHFQVRLFNLWKAYFSYSKIR